MARTCGGYSLQCWSHGEHLMCAADGGETWSETVSFGHRPCSSSQREEHSESFPHVGKDLNGGGRGEFHPPSVPIQILNVIRQDDA